MALDAATSMTSKTKVYKPALDDEDVQASLKLEVDDAVNYMAEAFAQNWEDAQGYFDGESGVEKVKGRSQVTATVVRNAIRGIKPSVMRIFASTRKIVEYLPNSRVGSELAYAQTLYVNQLFWENGGYRIISDLFDDAALKRIAAVQWYWDPNPVPCYVELTYIEESDYQQLVSDEDVTILEVTTHSETMDAYDQSQQQPVATTFYDVKLVYKEYQGRLCIETIPLPDFFISKNATDAYDARVIGFRKPMRVGDVVRMGIDADELEGLDDYDPEQSDGTSAESEKRRRVQKQRESSELDDTMRQVLITTVFARYDIDGVGIPQLWKFILGGTEGVILKKERADEPNIAVVNIDFRPHTINGSSIYDISAEDQDTMTSVLRSTLDNLHGANNRRLVVNDSVTNMVDVLSQTLNSPIRTRTVPANALQELGYTPTTGAALPLIQYLQQMADNRVGVTQAAAGLDPDALQSTDKDAVKNTIALMQGQVELICRNLAESLMPLFKGLLKLSRQHKSEYQDIALAGAAFPIDQRLLNPNLLMQPKIGIGTGDVTQQRASLQFVLQTQLMALQNLGPANPICNMSHISNTLEDICTSGSLNNPDRYFAPIDAKTGKQLAEQAAQAAEKAAQDAAQKPDPTVALLQAEQIKSSTAETVARVKALSDQRTQAIQKQFEAAQAGLTDDFNRDKLAQERFLAIANLVGQYGIQPAFDRANAQIEAEQNKARDADA